MRNQKYIRFANQFVLFESSIDHSAMYRALVNEGLYRAEDLKSAGFVFPIRECHSEFKNPGMHCFGNSVSLNHQALPEDTELLNKQLYGSSYEDAQQ